MLTRRGLIGAGAGALLGSGGAVRLRAAPAGRGKHEPRLELSPELPEGTRAEAVLDALPGKKPLIRLTQRPPNYETPIAFLQAPVTPNDAFFVRYHFPEIPEIEAGTWKLALGGEGAKRETQINLEVLKELPSQEIVAVCQCAGNRRGLFQPHVPGIQWGFGGMGCARWKGARLKDVLDLVGVKTETVEIVFEGADHPALVETPDFVKSLPLHKALEDDVLVAYEMNGEPLPHWNGFPARLIVPGWCATYWVKHLTSIRAVTRPFEGFWMKPAYRIPLGKFPSVSRFVSQETATDTPITEMMVSSLITSPSNGARIAYGARSSLNGIAWDAGYGITAVEISSDGGATWESAVLGEDLGRFAFRPWRFPFTARRRGTRTFLARATNRIGQIQTGELIFNPAGYHHNVIQSVSVHIA